MSRSAYRLPHEQHGDHSALREYLQVVRRRKWIVLICAIAVPVAALISGYTQLYRSGLGEIEPPGRGEASMLKADICSGWRSDGTNERLAACATRTHRASR